MVGRNDGYGGSFIERMQVSIELLGFYVAQHRLEIELILVDWNPPAERPQLSDVVVVPTPVKFVVVPGAVHGKIEGSECMPIFEYRAKNVGIRWASGGWVLVMNPDIILSEEIIIRIATTELGADCFYRAARHDVGWALPKTKAASVLMNFCHNNVQTVHNKYDAAGDFILMRREEWFRLRGFAEITSNGMIDSLMVATAEKEGLDQVNLAEPSYHQVQTRQERVGRPELPWDDGLIGIHNPENWGLRDEAAVVGKVIQ